MQGKISPSHLATTILYDVSRRWSQYLNRSVTASCSQVVEALGSRFPFSLKPILVDLEGGHYINLILPVSLANIISGRRSAGGCAPRSGSGNKNRCLRCSPRGDLQECRRATKCTCPPSPFGMWRTRGTFWWGKSSPPYTVTFLVRTGICEGYARRTESVKTRTPPPPPEVAITIAGLLKVAQGG